MDRDDNGMNFNRNHFHPYIRRRGTSSGREIGGIHRGQGVENNENRHNLSNRANWRRCKRNNQFNAIGFRRLEQLLEKEPNEIVVALATDTFSFEDYASKESTPDTFVLIIRLMAKMCETDTRELKLKVINIIAGKFMDNFVSYILKLFLQTAHEQKQNGYFWNHMDRFWSELLLICKNILDFAPYRACDVLPKLLNSLIVICFPQLESTKGVIIPDSIIVSFKELHEKLIIFREDRETKNRVSNSSGVNPVKEEEPPENFRTISLYPTPDEITTNKNIFLRSNIIHGKYIDVEHYLDVQFRLLRADFVLPLREGVQEYMAVLADPKRQKRLNSVRIHRKTQFLRPKQVHDKVGDLLQFDFTNKPKQHNFNQSRRYMFGSLLCFTQDNFETVIFGIIIERDITLLEKGQLVVKIVDDKRIEYKNFYVMAECQIYFQPYYHVMKALQFMDTEIFPMSTYLIDVNTIPTAPKYLTNNCVYEIDDEPIHVLNKTNWPGAKSLSLDDSQYEAFQNALTNEFAVIQGPPGTGKTYIGLKIARTLLQNQKWWYKNAHPILIICFTNHALDQFLEGIISTTDKIVRIGGQSKNEELKRFNLKSLRKTFDCNFDTRKFTRETRLQLKDKIRAIRAYSTELEFARAFEGVLNFKLFADLNLGYENSWFSNATPDAIIDWLLGGRTVGDRQIEIKKAFKTINQEKKTDLKYLDEMNDTNGDNNFDEYDILDDHIDQRSIYIITLEEEFKCLQQSEAKLIHLKASYRYNDFRFNQKILQLRQQKTTRQETVNYLKFRLNQCKSNIDTAHLRRTEMNLHNPHIMQPDLRWRMYSVWLRAHQNRLNTKITELNDAHSRLYRQYEEAQQLGDQRFIKQMLVVGMTTTGSARNQTLLQALKCPIVIVEEAAEVLESHIVVSLTKNCQHLILIGDHKQLKPNTAAYKLSKEYNFNISLFERMVNNGVHCSVLGVQHRMCKEVASLIVPTIYDSLINHNDVLCYPKVLGIEKNVFFLNHNELEEITGDNNSKRNLHEADMLIELARYLILQGYDPEDITILATYKGQMYAMWNIRKKYNILKNVRISVVDNFQGEENTIILLSLVRSNTENNIGFSGIENRVCVALSRAKHGLYIIGNMNVLTHRSTLWQNIKMSLEKLHSFGNSLSLKCQVHDITTLISKPADFSNVPEGGCTNLCGAELQCGHLCPSLCHILSREHSKVRCLKDCTKILCDNNHTCPKKCYQECGSCKYLVERTLQCKHTLKLACYIEVDTYSCLQLVKTTLPCQHTTYKPCHKNPKTFQCSFPCETRLECGHACELNCHIRNDADHIDYKCRKKCTKNRVGCSLKQNPHKCNLQCHESCKPCEMPIRKRRTVCSHAYYVTCNFNVDELICRKPCTKKLACGHKCRSVCNEPCGDCVVWVKKQIPGCKHDLLVKCHEEPDKKHCKGKCPLQLSCGHNCNKKCKELCTTKCEVLVESSDKGLCGHTIQKPCYLNNVASGIDRNELMKYCQSPCNAQLKCKHPCSGTCGECYQGRIHKSCNSSCNSDLICGHPCPVPCRSICLPCNKPCSYMCKHSKCKKICGAPCISCNEPCVRKCSHIRCTRKCGELCNVLPCIKPCKRKLKCGHPCVGFCGDPCPELCRFCDSETLSEIFFGNEDEADARFVLLVDCKHVFESDGLETWLKEDGGVIQLKLCPKCKTPITTTHRYANFIKTAYEDITTIKSRFYGAPDTNRQIQIKLLRRLIILLKGNGLLLEESIHWRPLVVILATSLKPIINNKINVVNAVKANTLTAQIEIVEEISNIFQRANLKSTMNIKKCIEYSDILLNLLRKQTLRITEQEREDFQAELMRLHRIVSLTTIKSTDAFKANKTIVDIATLYQKLKQQIFSIENYTQTMDEKIVLDLRELNKCLKGKLSITDAERKMIVQAMGFQRGHWYKCRNGHPYVIADCGGAMEVSKCNVCGESIGGNNHRLLDSNAVATEMDGARHGAWSEQANMENYDL